MNSENSKTSESHRIKSDLTDKLNSNTTLTNLSIFSTWKNIKSEYNNNKIKISAPTWNDTFDLPDGYYSFSDIQDHFEFIIKNHGTLTYRNKIKKRIVFKIKIGCKLQLLKQ